MTIRTSDVRPTPAHILLVQEELRLGRELVAQLEKAGHHVGWVMTARRAMMRFDPNCELVLVDLELPDLTGIATIHQVRTLSDVPIIALSGRESSATLSQSLEAGADDYLRKPCDSGELLWRCHARLRRPALGRDAPGTVGRLEVDHATSQFFVAGIELGLTPTERRVLSLLTREPGRTVSRRALEQRALTPSRQRSARTLDVHILNLRRKLGDAAQIETVRGIGFRIGPSTEPD